MKSIIQDEKVCLVCGTPYGLHKHHIFFGGNRQVSEREGFTCWLCASHHTGPYGVHFDKDLDTAIKQRCQAKYEETHTRAEFLKLIGKNYLEE